MITLKIPYKTSKENSLIIRDIRNQFSNLIRFSYNRAKEGVKQKEIRSLIKNLNHISLSSWFIQCSVMEGLSIFKRNKENKVIFGGKKNFYLRIKNKINAEELKEKRLNKITLQGEELQFGNRQFDFSLLDQNKLIFKVSRTQHLELFLQQMKKNYKKRLDYIQKISELKEKPITVSLDGSFVYLTYEEEPIRKTVLCSSRSMGIDMNPNQIGISIRHDNKIIFIQQFDLYQITNQMLKEHNSSSSKRSKYLNNKVRHEQIQISKKILEIALKYKVGVIFIEKLTNILDDNKQNKGKKFNRKTYNIWNRDLFINNLKKRCNLYSIRFYEIYPQYSSFIGNLMYDYTDPINASIEMARRGTDFFLAKDKTKFYPELTIDSLKDQWKKYLSEDVKTWKELKDKNPKMRYRVSLTEAKKKHRTRVFQMSSQKSKVTCHNFV